jgi:hypothetical protein
MAKLRQTFKVSHVTVWKALTYKTESALAEKIRYVALKQLGGTVSKDLQKSVECETSHEEVEKTMTQTFGPRVKLVFFKEGSVVKLYVDGKEEKKAYCKDIPSFVAFQKEVELKALTL